MTASMPRIPKPSQLLPTPSSLFNLFSSPTRSNSNKGVAPHPTAGGGDDVNYAPAAAAAAGGDLQLHRTHTAGDAAARCGGLAVLYPLLVTDATRQVRPSPS